MRYTTIIDISDMPEVYRNRTARLLYIHLALAAGYHDEDRDQVRQSLRVMALRAGLTLSAVRHALALLQRAGLVSKDGDVWKVKKWFVDTPPTPRRQPKDRRAAREASSVADKYDDELRKWRENVERAVREMTRADLLAWLDELRDGRSLRHHGAQLTANERNIAWLEGVIKQK